MNKFKKLSFRQEYLVGLLDKFPDHGTLTIAKVAIKEYPSFFLNLNSARNAVMRLRRGGTKAIAHRPRDPVPSGQSGFENLPKGITQLENWGPLQIDGKINALVLADVHFPFHDREALLLAIRYGRDNGVDTIILNGDTADFFAVSFWEKDPRQRDFKKELELVRAFLAMLREDFPKARIVFKAGNHEERYPRYMRVKAPELLGLKEFEVPALMEFDKHGVEYVEDKRPIRLGELNVIHGHEYNFAISNPVNPARGLFLRAKAYAICGHFHQSSYHTEKTVEQKIISTWSTGCLCDLHPEYRPMNNWGHGFARVEVANNGKFNMDHKVIRSGKIY